MALVAGASGVVGRRLAEYLHGLDDWDVVGLSRRAPVDGNDVPRIPVDLANREETVAALSGLSDVTHIFYEARFDHPEGEGESIETNTAMFRNLIDALVPIAARLAHVHVGSGHKNYGLDVGPSVTPAREGHPRFPRESFYYRQEDYVRAL